MASFESRSPASQNKDYTFPWANQIFAENLSKSCKIEKSQALYLVNTVACTGSLTLNQILT